MCATQIENYMLKKEIQNHHIIINKMLQVRSESSTKK